MVDNKFKSFKKEDISEMGINDDVINEFLNKMLELDIIEPKARKSSETYHLVIICTTLISGLNL